MGAIMVGDRGDGELASVSMLLFFFVFFFNRGGMAELSLILEEYTPNPADTEHTHIEDRDTLTCPYVVTLLHTCPVHTQTPISPTHHSEKQRNRPWWYADVEVMPTFMV